MPHADTALYFKHVIAISGGLALLDGLLHVEGSEPSLSRIMLLADGAWYHLYDLPDVVHDVLRRPAGEDRARDTYCLLGRNGLLRQHHAGAGFDDERLPLANPYIKALREIGGRLYAAGTQGQVLRREARGWVRMDDGLHAPLGDQVASSINALDGHAGNDLYAAGDGGALWHWDGTAWTRLDSPSDLPFEVVHRHADGSVLLAGAGGRLFQGNRHLGWRDLGDPAFGDLTITGAALFQGALYLCAERALLRCADGVLSRVEVPLPGPLAFHAVDACADALWCVGDGGVLSFDGRRWQAHACPENG